MNYALVNEAGEVTNITDIPATMVLLHAGEFWQIPVGITPVALPLGTEGAEVGGHYDGQMFTPRPPTEAEKLSDVLSYLVAFGARRYEYDFAVDGGAAGAFVLRSGDPIPANAIITQTLLKPFEALASSGPARVKMTIEEDGDLQYDILLSEIPGMGTETYTIGTPDNKGQVLMGGSTGVAVIETTVPRTPVFTVGDADLTGGRFAVLITYMVSIAAGI